MKQRIAELNWEWGDLLGSEPLQIRVGTNTGCCTVGNFGSEDRLDYTIVGGAVNATARLEATAEPDQIQISRATQSLVRDRFYCRSIGDINFEGISHQLRTYEVVGEFQNLGPEQRIESDGDFRISLDPTSLDSESGRQVMEALRTALAALDANDGEMP